MPSGAPPPPDPCPQREWRPGTGALQRKSVIPRFRQVCRSPSKSSQAGFVWQCPEITFNLRMRNTAGGEPDRIGQMCPRNHFSLRLRNRKPKPLSLLREAGARSSRCGVGLAVRLRCVKPQHGCQGRHAAPHAAEGCEDHRIPATSGNGTPAWSAAVSFCQTPESGLSRWTSGGRLAPRAEVQATEVREERQEWPENPAR